MSRFFSRCVSGRSSSDVRRAAGAAIEPLERRLVMSQSLLVTTAIDEDNATSDPAFGTGTSLREAIAYAKANPGDDVITFDETAFPLGSLTTIKLGGTELLIDDATAKVTIQGLGSDRIAVSGDNLSRIANATGELEISGLRLTLGKTTGFGGAIYATNDLTLLDCKVVENEAGSGGAIFSFNNKLRIERSTFAGNAAASAGGALYLGQVDAVLRDSTFSGNSIDASNGAAVVSQAQDIDTNLTAINCTFSGNTANGTAFGGALANVVQAPSATVTATMTLIHCTVTNNSVGEDGRAGGIVSVANGDDSTVLRLFNTIVSGNRRDTTPDDILASDTFTAKSSLIGEQAADGVVLDDGVDGNITGVTDPGLAALADNGGTTLTHSLLTTSPALNSGDDAFSLDENNDPLTSDQRADEFAFPRVVGSAVDIGAVELPPADLTINDITVEEGNSGFTAFTFTVKRAYADGFASVDWFTGDGVVAGAIAEAGFDYLSDLGTVEFAEGELESTLTVTVFGDIDFESDEQFLVTLDAPLNAQLKDPLGIGTIKNDDSNNPVPSLSISDASVVEGDSGLKNVNFVVTLSSPVNHPVTFKYGTAPGTATNNTDYLPRFRTATIPALSRTAVVTVQVVGDKVVEANETFFVKLKEPTGATIADDTGVGTIVNNDGLPKIRINNAPSVLEGNSGTKLMTFTVTLDKASTAAVSVKFATADGTASAALNDYKAKSGTLTFTAGQTSKTITVTIVGDTRKGGSETVFVNLTNPIGATIADGQGVGTILNDD